MKAAFLADLTDAKLIFILRATMVLDLDGWVDAAVEGGARWLEITLPTPGALPAIARARSRHPGLRIGGGTVCTVDEVGALADAGASFAVSPHFDAGLIEACTLRGLASVPGVLTPTEMMAAWRAGATALKLFPAPSCSVVRALRAPLPDLPLVAVGGVSKENLGEYLKSGCVAGGVGASVFAPGVTCAEIRQRVAELVRVAQSAAG